MLPPTCCIVVEIERRGQLWDVLKKETTSAGSDWMKGIKALGESCLPLGTEIAPWAFPKSHEGLTSLAWGV
jgi:hypothetical protein